MIIRSLADLAADLGPHWTRVALAVRVDGAMKDLLLPIEVDATVSLVTADDPDAAPLLRHDAAPRDGGSGAGTLSRHSGDHRSGNRERLLLRLRPSGAIYARGSAAH